MTLDEWNERELARLTEMEKRLVKEWQRTEARRAQLDANPKSPYQLKLEWLLGYVPSVEEARK